MDRSDAYPRAQFLGHCHANSSEGAAPASAQGMVPTPAVLKKLMRHRAISTTLRYYVEQEAEDIAGVVWEAYRKRPARNTFGNTFGNTRAKNASFPGD